MENKPVRVIDILDATQSDLHTQTIKMWTNAFMFFDNFDKSKRFERYVSKMESAAYQFFEDATKWGDPSLSMQMYGCFYTIFNAEAPNIKRGCAGWPDNLIPLYGCVPRHLKDANNAIYNGWRATLQNEKLWNDIYNVALPTACIHFLHDMYVKYEDIDEENFCIRGVPRNNTDYMMFIKLLMNLIWTGAWSLFCLTDQAYVDKLKNDRDSLKEEKDKLESELKEFKTNAINDYNRRIEEVKREKHNEMQNQISDYRSELAGEFATLNKKNRLLEEELTKLKERYAELKEEIDILTEADEDEEELLPDNPLTYNSNIVFITSAIKDGPYDVNLERLRQRLPNCRFIHKADDIIAGADCYVLLTRFMKHHNIYNSARDTLSKHNLPYLHSSSYNVDRILYDIFHRTKYTEQ